MIDLSFDPNDDFFEALYDAYAETLVAWSDSKETSEDSQGQPIGEPPPVAVGM